MGSFAPIAVVRVNSAEPPVPTLMRHASPAIGRGTSKWTFVRGFRAFTHKAEFAVASNYPPVRRIQGVTVLASRKPRKEFRLYGTTMVSRYAARTNRGMLFQEPPRITRVLQSPETQAAASTGAPT
jgi:hypothetical protein